MHVRKEAGYQISFVCYCSHKYPKGSLALIAHQLTQNWSSRVFSEHPLCMTHPKTVLNDSSQSIFLLFLLTHGIRQRKYCYLLLAWESATNNILTTVGQSWAKYHDLQDSKKLQYFALTEFNNCFIIRSSLFSHFNRFLAAQGGDLPFFPWELVPITHEQV